MTLKECYTAMGGNYEEAIGRLRSERLVQKFVLKFLKDGSYDLLCKSFESHDQEEAFRAAHTIKGVCQNLAITQLGKSSEQLTEALRTEWTQEVDELVKQVHEDYKKTTDAIRAFEAGLS